MKSWGLALFFLVSIGLTSCVQKTEEVTEPKSTDLVSDPKPVAFKNDCSSVGQMVCTREYRPTTCMFAKQEFASSNPCEAKRLVKTYACTNNVPYTDEQVICNATAIVKVKGDCTGGIKVCTREFKPQVCRFGKIEGKGNNACEAMNTLRIAACSEQIEFTDDQADCQAAANEKPKKNRSR